MHVLHIDTGRTMRGGQYQVLLLHDSLVERGCTQTVLAGDGIRSHRPFGRATWQAVRHHARRCDIVHVHDARAHLLAALYAGSTPVVVSRRVAFATGSGFLSRWKYRRANHFIAVSRHVAAVLREGGIPASKVSVVHDAAPDVAAEQQQGAHTDRLGSQEEFVVVSPNLDDPLKCRDLAVSGCREAGIPLKLSDNLQTDLRSADALLYLSRTEGLGSALLLAMSLGVPCVASDVGGIPEVVSSGRTGLLVENDANSIARALRKLQASRSLREQMGVECLKRVQVDFSRERMADRTLRVYRQLVGDST